MKKLLKRHFIPHKGNNYKPHFLQKNSLSFIVVFLIVIECALLFSSFTIFKNGNFLAAVLPGTLVSLTNENRLAYHVGELKVNPLLTKAAELKAKDMALKGYFAHISPEGLNPWHWLDAAGYSYLYAGENLAVNFFDSKDVSDAWMNSQAHKENIINNSYSEIGIATAEGIYKGQRVTFVVQFFGTPAPTVPDEWRKVLAENPKNTVTAPVVKPGTISQAPSKSQNKNTLPAKPAPQTQVKGESTVPSPTPSPFSSSALQNKPLLKILESPHTAVATVLLAILLLLSVVLALAILIEIKIQHPKMIFGTLLVILVALGILYLNSKVFISMTEVPSDTNFAATFIAF